MPGEQIVEILKLGLIGLCFLFCWLAYSLLKSEQKRDGEIRKRMLTGMVIFMVFAMVVLFSYAGMELTKLISSQKSMQLTEKINAQEEQLQEQSQTISELQKNLQIYQERWTVNGTFQLDYYNEAKDMKFYTVPPTELTLYVKDVDYTGFTIPNFRVELVNGKRSFPDIGFRNSHWDSAGCHKISDDEINVAERKINILEPIRFVPK